MKHLILTLLLLGILLLPMATAQTQDIGGWTINVDKPFYYVGDNMNVTVTGIYGMNYSVDLANTTTWTTIHLTTRGIPESGIDIWDIDLDDDWIPGGRYYLNISVDGFHMVHRLIRIDYSADYLHEKEHDWLRDMVAGLERGLGNMYDDFLLMWDEMSLIKRIMFVLFLAVLVMGGQHFLHVTLPVFHSWSQRSTAYGVKKKSRFGLTAGQIVWHDRELPRIADGHKPNIKALARNAEDIGLTPEQTKMVVWEASGSPGEGDFVRDILTKLKWSRLKYKLLRKMRLERGVVGSAYVEQADDLLKKLDIDFKLANTKEEADKLYIQFRKDMKNIGKDADKELKDE